MKTVSPFNANWQQETHTQGRSTFPSPFQIRKDNNGKQNQRRLSTPYRDKNPTWKKTKQKVKENFTVQGKALQKTNTVATRPLL
jgi:hypothetical protein